MPLFSIIIPVYNKENDIGSTLTSVFLQTETDYEIILMNDGSTDKSEKVIKSFDDPRIKYYSKENEGVSTTRNLAVTKASGAHLAFLDADDYWFPNHLENLKNLIVKFPEGKWYATAYEKKFNEKLVRPMRSPIMQKPEDWKGMVPDFFQNSLVDSLAWTSAVCIKTDFFNTLGGFDTKITHGAGEDTDLWIRAALESPLVFSIKITARHHLDGSNRISHTPTLTRNFLDLDKYERYTKYHEGLKSYLDLNRFSIAMQYKLAGDDKRFKRYLKALDKNNLSARQRFLTKQSSKSLRFLFTAKSTLENLGFRLSSYRKPDFSLRF